MTKKNKTDEIVSEFFSAFRALKHKLDLSSPLFHLPIAQMETLRFLAEKKHVLMKELADFLAITPPSVTVLVNNLVFLEFAQRHSDTTDRRTVRLSLTKKGRDILDKATKQRCQVFKRLLSRINPQEQIKLLRILKKMNHDN